MVRCIVVAAVLSLSCHSPYAKPTITNVRIATGNPSGLYHALGVALADMSSALGPHVHSFAHPTPSMSANLDALERSEMDFGFASADILYTAVTRGTALHPAPHTNLRAVAVLYSSAIQIIVRATSRIASVPGLRGARVALGITGPTRVDARDSEIPTWLDLLSAGYKISHSDLLVRPMTFDEMAGAISTGQIDGAVMLAGYPINAFADLAKNGRSGIKLLPIDRAAASRLRSHAPFYKPVVIPADTYAGQAKAVHTVGVESLLVCRADLDEGVVYRLTKTFFEMLPQLDEKLPAARQIDPDLAPATPIPLHAGAARYFREREVLR